MEPTQVTGNRVAVMLSLGPEYGIASAECLRNGALLDHFFDERFFRDLSGSPQGYQFEVTRALHENRSRRTAEDLAAVTPDDICDGSQSICVVEITDQFREGYGVILPRLKGAPCIEPLTSPRDCNCPKPHFVAG